MLVAEGDEGELGVCGLAADLAGGGVLPCVCDADFVFELEDDALGGFFPDAFALGE